MRGLLIDPTARVITEVNVGDEDIARTIGASLFDVVPLTPSEDMYIDYEGLLTYPNPLGYFELRDFIFAGRALVLGSYRANRHVGYEATDTRLAVKTLAPFIKWLDTPPQESVEPRLEFVEYPEDDE